MNLLEPLFRFCFFFIISTFLVFALKEMVKDFASWTSEFVLIPFKQLVKRIVIVLAVKRGHKVKEKESSHAVEMDTK